MVRPGLASSLSYLARHQLSYCLTQQVREGNRAESCTSTDEELFGSGDFAFQVALLTSLCVAMKASEEYVKNVTAMSDDERSAVRVLCLYCMGKGVQKYHRLVEAYKAMPRKVFLVKKFKLKLSKRNAVMTLMDNPSRDAMGMQIVHTVAENAKYYLMLPYLPLR